MSELFVRNQLDVYIDSSSAAKPRSKFNRKYIKHLSIEETIHSGGVGETVVVAKNWDNHDVNLMSGCPAAAALYIWPITEINSNWNCLGMN